MWYNGIRDAAWCLGAVARVRQHPHEISRFGPNNAGKCGGARDLKKVDGQWEYMCDSCLRGVPESGTGPHQTAEMEGKAHGQPPCENSGSPLSSQGGGLPLKGSE